ncbi:hypothetical protein [Methylovulum psychrotolerans]|uniref:hypothetical protein n=1 Tax=Methylovulum psychrotolerans TaxID=1704499 RepID=UPI000CDE6EEE|nr:hypothetical protein [Methylovulum psychrotolerans]
MHLVEQALDYPFQLVLVAPVGSDDAVALVGGHIETFFNIIKPDDLPPDDCNGPKTAAPAAVGLLLTAIKLRI